MWTENKFTEFIALIIMVLVAIKGWIPQIFSFLNM